MKLKDIAVAILAKYDDFTCKVQNKKNQIVVQSSLWPNETVHLLSPYYQEKLRNNEFTEKDLENVLVEADRIHTKGW